MIQVKRERDSKSIFIIAYHKKYYRDMLMIMSVDLQVHFPRQYAKGFFFYFAFYYYFWTPWNLNSLLTGWTITIHCRIVLWLISSLRLATAPRSTFINIYSIVIITPLVLYIPGLNKSYSINYALFIPAYCHALKAMLRETMTFFAYWKKNNNLFMTVVSLRTYLNKFMYWSSVCQLVSNFSTGKENNITQQKLWATWIVQDAQK